MNSSKSFSLFSCSLIKREQCMSQIGACPIHYIQPLCTLGKYFWVFSRSRESAENDHEFNIVAATHPCCTTYSKTDITKMTNSGMTGCTVCTTSLYSYDARRTYRTPGRGEKEGPYSPTTFETEARYSWPIGKEVLCHFHLQ